MCNIITEQTTIKTDFDGFQEILGKATNTVVEGQADNITAFIILNPKLSNPDDAYKWGQELGYEITHNLMQNCVIYQEVILNKGNSIPAFSPITEEIGQEIEAKVKAKSKKKTLSFDKANNIMLKELGANKDKIQTNYHGEISQFPNELILYLFTKTENYSKSAVLKMSKDK